jgi:hypothetical protein
VFERDDEALESARRRKLIFATASCGLNPWLCPGNRSTAMGAISLPDDHFALAHLGASQMGMGGAWTLARTWRLVSVKRGSPPRTTHHVM